MAGTPSPPSLRSAVLARLWAHSGGALAVADSRGEHSFEQIRAGAARLATLLRPHEHSGDLQGRRVAMLVRPGAEWVQTFVGILSAGGVAVPLSPLYPPPERRWLIADAGAQTLVASDDWLDEPLPDCCRVLTTAAAFSVEPQPSAECLVADEEPSPREPRERWPSRTGQGCDPHAEQVELHPALLLYTSGTTGKPKGVVLTHGNLAVQTRLLERAWGLGPEDVLLHALPLHHMHGIAIALLPCLLAGAAIRMLERFVAETVWDALAGATTFMAVPTMYHRLFEAFDRAPTPTQERWQTAARALRLATSGSAALPATLAERWRKLTGIIPLERFGMTELGVGMSNGLDPADRQVGSVGHPPPGLELRLVDEAGRDMPGEGPGEVWLRGPSVFPGYLGRPEATREAFAGEWFKTGDTAMREPDGRIRILGRTSVDILKSGGYKLSALEIEEALRVHEAISEIAVVGLPDEVWGQRVVAVVVPRGDRRVDCESEGLRAWAKQRLAPYKVPRQFVVVESLPRNAMGKVVKPELVRSLRP